MLRARVGRDPPCGGPRGGHRPAVLPVVPGPSSPRGDQEDDRRDDEEGADQPHEPDHRSDELADHRVGTRWTITANGLRVPIARARWPRCGAFSRSDPPTGAQHPFPLLRPGLTRVARGEAGDLRRVSQRQPAATRTRSSAAPRIRSGMRTGRTASIGRASFRLFAIGRASMIVPTRGGCQTPALHSRAARRGLSVTGVPTFRRGRAL